MIDEAVMHIDRRDEILDLLREAEERINQFLERARALYSAIGRSFPGEEEISQDLDLLFKELDEAGKDLVRLNELNDQLELLDEKIKGVEQGLTSVENEIEGLFKSASVLDEEAFRRKARIHQKRLELQDELRHLEARLRAVSGKEDVSLIDDELKNLKREDLEAEAAGLEKELDHIASEQDELYRKRAELLKDMEHLASSDDLSRLRFKEETIIQKIRKDAMEWARYSVASFLLNESKRRFEQEKQPKVIKDGSSYFEMITGGAYSRIVAPIGQNIVQVMNSRGEVKGPIELSRGTREQLYLALRFGYISNYEVGGERLPVIMDDILVNFDAQRAKLAIKTILELGLEQQILFFTCHRRT